MFDYNRMTSIFKTEFMPCGNLSLGKLESAVIRCFQKANIPIETEQDKVKAGLLSKDPCLVIYNPENLQYHTIVLVIRDLNNTRVVSAYSAGSASGMHIGGGILNMENRSNKLKNVFKSGKQKEAEEQEYNASAFRCVYDSLVECGVYVN